MPNFEEMNVKELKDYAAQNNIDLGNLKKKTDIIVVITKYSTTNIKEGTNMPENEGQVTETGVQDEMTPNQDVDTNVPEGNAGDAASTKEEKVWKDAEGNEISMSQFIREKFTKDNMSRKEISDTYEINYRTVYGATVNMENASDPSTRGRGIVNPKILVTADNKVLTKVVTAAVEASEGVEATPEVVTYFLDNEEIVANEAGEVVVPEAVETDRNTWIKDQVAAGANRGDIAKALNLSYGVVYGLTKEEEGTRQKYEVETTDAEGNTVSIPRSEYIRKRVAEGASKSDVAKELGVEYSVVWQATKKDKSDEEKLAEALETLAKFADKMEDKDAFTAAVEVVKGFKLKPEEKEEDKDEAADATSEDAAEAPAEDAEGSQEA
ncbi:MAG: hypothetical protein RR324_01200 [Cellulosilyticaceae bacterium]